MSRNKSTGDDTDRVARQYFENNPSVLKKDCHILNVVGNCFEGNHSILNGAILKIIATFSM